MSLVPHLKRIAKLQVIIIYNCVCLKNFEILYFTYTFMMDVILGLYIKKSRLETSISLNMQQPLL